MSFQAQAQLPATEQQLERLSAVSSSLRAKLELERDRGRHLQAEVESLRQQDVQRWVFSAGGEKVPAHAGMKFYGRNPDARP